MKYKVRGKNVYAVLTNVKDLNEYSKKHNLSEEQFEKLSTKIKNEFPVDVYQTKVGFKIYHATQNEKEEEKGKKVRIITHNGRKAIVRTLIKVAPTMETNVFMQYDCGHRRAYPSSNVERSVKHAQEHIGEEYACYACYDEMFHEKAKS